MVSKMKRFQASHHANWSRAESLAPSGSPNHKRSRSVKLLLPPAIHPATSASALQPHAPSAPRKGLTHSYLAATLNTPLPKTPLPNAFRKGVKPFYIFRILIFHIFTTCFTIVYMCIFLPNVWVHTLSVQSSSWPRGSAASPSPML